jgi:hypothetical protein
MSLLISATTDGDQWPLLGVILTFVVLPVTIWQLVRAVRRLWRSQRRSLQMAAILVLVVDLGLVAFWAAIIFVRLFAGGID